MPSKRQFTDDKPWSNPRLAGRIPELDGLRGLAILLVLLWHLLQVKTGQRNLAAYAMVSLRLTWSGVDLFFVLSGFLIGGILVDQRASRAYFRPFYQRRAARILPIYYLSWILYMALRALVHPAAGPLAGLLGDPLPVWSFPLFLQNFFQAARGTFGNDWLGITWSLAVEEQFYLILPLVVRYVRPRLLPWIMLALVMVAPALRAWCFHRGNEFYAPHVLLPCRIDAFALGVLAALLLRHRAASSWLDAHRRAPLSLLGLLSVGLAWLTFHPDGLAMIVGGYSVIALFYAALLVHVVSHPAALLGRLMRARVLGELGTISYAVYLIHQAMNRALHYALFHEAPSIHDGRTLAATLLGLAATIALARLSIRVLERPLLAAAHARFRYDPLPRAAAAGG